MGWFVHRWGREQTSLLGRWEGAAGFGKALGLFSGRLRDGVVLFASEGEQGLGCWQDRGMSAGQGVREEGGSAGWGRKGRPCINPGP